MRTSLPSHFCACCLCLYLIIFLNEIQCNQTSREGESYQWLAEELAEEDFRQAQGPGKRRRGKAYSLHDEFMQQQMELKGKKKRSREQGARIAAYCLGDYFKMKDIVSFFLNNSYKTNFYRDAFHVGM